MAVAVVQASEGVGQVDRAQECADLERHVDHLLTQYLELLDEYTLARDALSKKLSAGFVSLADANFTAPRGVRYGQDFFDQRMQASRTIDIADSEETRTLSIIKDSEVSRPAQKEDTDPRTKTEAASNAELPNASSVEDTMETAVPNTASAEDQGKRSGEGLTLTDSAQCRAPTDPLLWFGVFVSPKLRSTQVHFAEALESAAMTAIQTDYKMRLLEIDIRRQRKYLAKLRS